jgi:hypothetical protein
VNRRIYPARAIVGALLLCGALALPGCATPGAAGVSTSVEASPPTTERTPGTATATDKERQKLRHAWDVLVRQAAGIRLDITPLMEDCINQSQLIIHGTVVKVDPLHAPAGDVANPYIVFYVKPTEVLKGSPKLGTPIPFALLAPGKESAKQDKGYTPVSPVAEGDEILACSYGGNKNLPTASGPPGAYFLWNDNYGLFLPADGELVNVLKPFTYARLKEIRTMIGPKDTSTTLPPGFLSFEGKADRFEERLVGKRLPGTLPYEVLAYETGWLDDALAPAVMTHAKAYRLANGDRVFLWRTTYPGSAWAAQEQAVLKNLKAAAAERYDVNAKHVGAFWYGEFGFVIIAGDYVDALLTLAQMAETGQPLN